MPALNWDVFVGLPGATTTNFEMLCRALVRRHYARYGRFTALASQAGVEFDLILDQNCSLGAPGRRYGWQCRWYDLPSGRAIGTTRRNKIAEALATSERELPGLTDWVLWTRHPLTEGDQDWFQTLPTQVRLHAWTSAEVEEHLSGEADILRATYFGELVLTPTTLQALHERAVAPIGARWQPEVHQVVQAESVLRTVLAAPNAWTDLATQADVVQASADGLRGLPDLSAVHTATVEGLLDKAAEHVTMLCDARHWLEEGDLERVRTVLTSLPQNLSAEERALPRRLRTLRLAHALFATNLIADVQEAREIYKDLLRHVNLGLVSVTAEAGHGKTELAVSVSLPEERRPAGLLLHGHALAARQTLDDLARGVVIHGRPVASMEALVAALDAAGRRAGRRVPLVIDGLNEAEDPRVWQGLLASLRVVLTAYPYVLVVVTVRPGFVDDALPLETASINISGFAEDTEEAVRRYFTHYRIDPGDAEVPLDMLQEPLTLRLYCEVTNPSRERVVGMEAMPTSLTALYDRFLQQVAERTAALSPPYQRLHQQDVEQAFVEIGRQLWETGSRTLVVSDLRRVLGDQHRSWDTSIVRALEQGRLLLRAPAKPGSLDQRVMVVYDRLAGHLVARALLHTTRPLDLESWARIPRTVAAFTYGPEQHTLAPDVFTALVGLTPRLHRGQQWWRVLDGALRMNALAGTLQLEPHLLDPVTVDELRVTAKRNPTALPGLFDQLRRARAVPTHPLNAEFTHDVLSALSVARRDLAWSEWIRRHAAGLLSDVEYLEGRWRGGSDVDEAELLRAIWVAWTPTTTHRPLRDLATRALHWFGYQHPTLLLPLLARFLPVNDPYVVERVLAAVSGAAEAREQEHDGAFIHGELPRLALLVFKEVFAQGAPAATTHVLTLSYARRLIRAALRHHPNLLDPAELTRVTGPYPHDLRPLLGTREDEDDAFNAHDVLKMDFENYTLSVLVPERGNYNYDHAGYQLVRRQILWRVHELGYDRRLFKDMDLEIARRDHSNRSADGHKTERYGKKYGWIAFHELAGRLLDDGELGEYRRALDFSDVDISFPEAPRTLEVVRDDWLGEPQQDFTGWIVDGGEPNVTPYVLLGELESVPGGPWIALNGHVRQTDESSGRVLLAFIHAFLVRAVDAPTLISLLEAQEPRDLQLPHQRNPSEAFAADLPVGDAGPWFEVTLRRVLGKVNDVEQHLVLHRGGVPIEDEECADVLAAAQPLEGEEDSDEAWDQALTQELERRGIEWRLDDVMVERDDVEERRTDVYVPVEDGSWPAYKSAANPEWHATVPTRHLVEALGLRRRTHSFDFVDAAGVVQAIYVGHGEYLHDQQSFTYLSREVLKPFLMEHELCVVWAVWGERTLTGRAIHEVRSESGDPLNSRAAVHQKFSKVTSWDPNSL